MSANGAAILAAALGVRPPFLVRRVDRHYRTRSSRVGARGTIRRQRGVKCGSSPCPRNEATTPPWVADATIMTASSPKRSLGFQRIRLTSDAVPSSWSLRLLALLGQNLEAHLLSWRSDDTSASAGAQRLGELCPSTRQRRNQCLKPACLSSARHAGEAPRSTDHVDDGRSLRAPASPGPPHKNHASRGALALKTVGLRGALWVWRSPQMGA